MAGESEAAIASLPRYRLRFNTRTLLLTIAVVAAVLVVINNYVRPKLEHRFAVGRIFQSGGAIWFQDKSEDIGVQNPYTTPTLHLWNSVDSIDVKNDTQASVVANELARIPETNAIEFGRGVTDAGLTTVCESHNCNAIVTISLYGCSITSGGISKLDRLPKLQRIMFNTCPVNAAGLAQLQAIRTLRQLDFVEEPPKANYSRLNDACFNEIARLTQLETLVFADVKVSDAAARKLGGLKQLKKLSFHQGYISDAAVTQLRSELPTTEIQVY